MIAAMLRRGRSRVFVYLQPLLILVAIWVTMAIWIPEFTGESAVFAVFENLSLLGLVALGVTVTLIAGELDLSVSSMAAVGAIVAAKVSGGGLVVALVVPILVCAALGLLQGFIIGRFRINSLMFTIGTLIALRGLCFVIADNTTVPIANLATSEELLIRYAVFSPSSLIALGAFVVVAAFLAFTRPGRNLYAIGGGRVEAGAAGISATRSVALAFAISAGCAGLAGALAAVRGGSAAPNNYSELLLPAVAAALVGGVAFGGGRGSPLNAVLGTLTLGVISAALIVHGSEQSVALLVQGGVLLAVLALEFAVIRIASRGRRRVRLSLPRGAAVRRT